MAAAVEINPTWGVFVKPVTEEFGWSRSVFAGAVTIGTILGGLLALIIGPLLDRFGARWVLFSGFLVVGGIHLALGSAHRLWHVYLVIICGRMLLQGIFNLTGSVVIAKWFLRQRGRAIAIGSLGQRLGGAIIPYLAQGFITRSGWRTATVAMGFLAWGLSLLPVLVWLRRQPEDMGLAPDGAVDSGAATSEASQGPRPRQPAEESVTLREALRSPTFYILLGAFSLTSFTTTGVTFHMPPLLTDRGLTATEAIIVVSAWSLVGIPTTLATGLLAEGLTLRYLMAGYYLGLALGVAMLTQVESFGLGLLFASVHGACFASILLLQSLMLANYYGPASLGAIRGFVTPFMMISNSTGPLVAALVFDTKGSYVPILVVYMGMLALISASMLLATPPRRKKLAADTRSATPVP